MTFFIRTKNNNTIIETELFIKDDCVDLSSSISITHYSITLIQKIKENTHNSFISDIESLYELRAWLWEDFLHMKNKKDKYDEVLNAVKEKYKYIANKNNLNFVID